MRTADLANTRKRKQAHDTSDIPTGKLSRKQLDRRLTETSEAMEESVSKLYSCAEDMRQGLDFPECFSSKEDCDEAVEELLSDLALIENQCAEAQELLRFAFAMPTDEDKARHPSAGAV